MVPLKAYPFVIPVPPLVLLGRQCNNDPLHHMLVLMVYSLVHRLVQAVLFQVQVHAPCRSISRRILLLQVEAILVLMDRIPRRNNFSNLLLFHKDLPRGHRQPKDSRHKLVLPPAIIPTVPSRDGSERICFFKPNTMVSSFYYSFFFGC